MLTVADQLIHADWLHDLIDPVLDRNGIVIPELPPIGLCLALHGARRYFSLYWPPADDDGDERQRREDGDGGAFLGMDDDDNDDTSSPSSSKKRLGLDEQSFGAWLERLMDGQLPRLHVEAWPEDLATDEANDEEPEDVSD